MSSSARALSDGEWEGEGVAGSGGYGPCSTQSSAWRGLGILPQSQPSYSGGFSSPFPCLSGTSSICLSLWDPWLAGFPNKSLPWPLVHALLAAHSLVGISVCGGGGEHCIRMSLEL